MDLLWKLSVPLPFKTELSSWVCLFFFLGSPLGTRVGVVQYSHKGTFQAIRPDDPKITSLATFRDAVKNLEWIAGGTFTPSALEFAYDQLIRTTKRPQVPVSVVVITDGRYDKRDDEEKLRVLCQRGGPRVDVHAIGIYDMFEKVSDDGILLSIACNNSRRLSHLTKYTDLLAESFLQDIESKLCPSKSAHTVCTHT